MIFRYNIAVLFGRVGQRTRFEPVGLFSETFGEEKKMAGWKRLSHAANTECSFYWDKPFPSRPTTGRKPEARRASTLYYQTYEITKKAFPCRTRATFANPVPTPFGRTSELPAWQTR